MVRWEDGRFLVLFKGGEHRVSPRFYLFVSDVMERHYLDHPRVFKNIGVRMCAIRN